jgi:hypothetical protein
MGALSYKGSEVTYTLGFAACLDGRLMAADAPSASCVRVWSTFADQFLDTETRTGIPFAALAAVDAGLTIEEAAEVWLHEVVPVVGPNLLSVAGEWVGWSDAWLIEHIGPLHRARRPIGRIADHALGGLLSNRFTWEAIAGCMRHLLELAPEQRVLRARSLASLAAHYFDFVPKPLVDLPPEEQELLPWLSREHFRPLFEPLVHTTTGGESVQRCAERVQRALDEVRASRPPSR